MALILWYLSCPGRSVPGHPKDALNTLWAKVLLTRPRNWRLKLNPQEILLSFGANYKESPVGPHRVSVCECESEALWAKRHPCLSPRFSPSCDVRTQVCSESDFQAFRSVTHSSAPPEEHSDVVAEPHVGSFDVLIAS